jgi:hypothetical protein
MIWKIQGYRSRRRIVKIFNKYKKEEWLKKQKNQHLEGYAVSVMSGLCLQQNMKSCVWIVIVKAGE